MKKLLIIIGIILIIFLVFLIGGWFWKKTPLSFQSSTPPPSNQPTMSDEQLKKEIGQMILVGFRGISASDDSYIAKVIKEVNIGGVILFDYDVPSKSFPRNIQGPNQTKTLIANLQSYAATPLFISVDAEGGKVNRLQEKYGFLSIPSAQKMGSKEVAETTKQSQLLAKELKNLGINMNFAPVVDVNVNPKNPIIGALGRSFSDDPMIVTQDAAAFIKEQNAMGVITVEKHFPGHGSSTGDSHLGLVDVTTTYQNEELLPYQRLQQFNLLDVVMTAHIMNRNIDKDYPATLSPLFLQDILRKKIGFEGVIISDDMNMGAITKNYGFQDALVRAIGAGCDILLFSNNGTESYDEQLPYKAIDIIFNAVKEGRISQERIHQSYTRIFALKKKYGLL